MTVVKKPGVFCFAFSLGLAGCAAIAWISGFNFDQRNIDVAIWSAMSVSIAFIFGGLVVNSIA